MAEPTQDELAALDARIQASPAYQAFKAKPNKTAMDFIRLGPALARDGVRLPHDYQLKFHPGVQGPVIAKKGFLDRNGWAIPALIIGGTLTGGAALSAFGGAAGAAGAAGAGGAGGAGAAGGAAAGVLPATTVSALGTMPAATSSILPALGGTTIPTAAGGPGILGTLGKYSKMAGDIGEVAGGVSQSLQEGRRADDVADFMAASQNNRALVDAASFNRDLPMTRAQQTARGDLMASPMQNASSTGSGRDIQFTGGVRPSSFGADTTAAGEELKRQALAKLMDPEADKLTPQITQPRRAGAGENAAGIAGTGLSILGAYNRYRGGR